MRDSELVSSSYHCFWSSDKICGTVCAETSSFPNFQPKSSSKFLCLHFVPLWSSAQLIVCLDKPNSTLFPHTQPSNFFCHLVYFTSHFKPSVPIKNTPTFHITLSLCWHLQLHSHFCLNLPEGWCKCAAPVMHHTHTHTCTNTPTPLLMLVCFTNAQGTTRHVTTHPCLVTLQSLHKVISVCTFFYINCSTMQINKFTAILSDLYPVIQISIYFN
jgi:hypothetical protein